MLLDICDGTSLHTLQPPTIEAAVQEGALVRGAGAGASASALVLLVADISDQRLCLCLRRLNLRIGRAFESVSPLTT